MVRLLLGKKKKGYVTLLSVLILSSVASIVVTSNLSIDTDNIIAVSTFEQSKQAKALADTCMEEAIDRLKVNLSYTGNQTITLGRGSCTIGTITGTGNTNRTIQTTGTVNTVIRKINVTITTVNPLTLISSWTES